MARGFCCGRWRARCHSRQGLCNVRLDMIKRFRRFRKQSSDRVCKGRFLFFEDGSCHRVQLGRRPRGFSAASAFCNQMPDRAERRSGGVLRIGLSGGMIKWGRCRPVERRVSCRACAFFHALSARWLILIHDRCDPLAVLLSGFIRIDHNIALFQIEHDRNATDSATRPIRQHFPGIV